MFTNNNVVFLELALCEGRHEITEATDGAIFDEIPEAIITNPALLEDVAFSRLWGICYKAGLIDQDSENLYAVRIRRGTHLNIYVTGLTVSLIAVLNVAKREGVNVTLFHYDRETGSYYSQEVV